jgi:HEPN domain-containing protein
MSPEMPPGSPGDWLRRARSDLALAQAPRPAGVLIEDLCFHAQQAAEKALKAVLVENAILVPRTHSIPRLLDLIPSHLQPPQKVQEAAILTDYAVTSRYPGSYEPVETAEYEEALALAVAVVSWASAQVDRSLE